LPFAKLFAFLPIARTWQWGSFRLFHHELNGGLWLRPFSRLPSHSTHFGIISTKKGTFTPSLHLPSPRSLPIYKRETGDDGRKIRHPSITATTSLLKTLQVNPTIRRLYILFNGAIYQVSALYWAWKSTRFAMSPHASGVVELPSQQWTILTSFALFPSVSTMVIPTTRHKWILGAISSFNPLHLHLPYSGFASENHCFCTWLTKNTITQQENGLWSSKKLQKLNNTHGKPPAKSGCNSSNASFVSIFRLTEPVFCCAFSTVDATLHNRATPRNNNNNNNNNNNHTITTTTIYCSNY